LGEEQREGTDILRKMRRSKSCSLKKNRKEEDNSEPNLHPNSNPNLPPRTIKKTKDNKRKRSIDKTKD
jgi:hypothetical protein